MLASSEPLISHSVRENEGFFVLRRDWERAVEIFRQRPPEAVARVTVVEIRLPRLDARETAQDQRVAVFAEAGFETFHSHEKILPLCADFVNFCPRARLHPRLLSVLPASRPIGGIAPCLLPVRLRKLSACGSVRDGSRAAARKRREISNALHMARGSAIMPLQGVRHMHPCS